ncbi:MAG: sulfatase [Cyclobacteriaceae bacterium]
MRLSNTTFALLLLALFCAGCSDKPGTNSPKPNILFAILDDATFSHFGAYGCDWVKTPAFDRVANEGILFMNAYTPNAKCAPSRASILTGRNSWQLEEAGNHWCYYPQKFKTYAESLSESGYHVGYSGKGWAPGIPGEINGQKRQLAGQPYSNKKTTPPTKAISNNDYTANFQDFLASKKEGSPFCFWYGSTEPHRAYEYGTGISKGGKNTGEVDFVYSFWPDNDTVRTDMLDYAFEIEYADKHLGNMLKMLEEWGELDNTLVVVTSDNGMPFPRIKGQEYELSNHLPLAVMWPKGIKNPGRKVEDFISFIDFAPTFLEVAGVQTGDTGMQPVQGKSLLNIFNSEKAGKVDASRDHVLIGKERHDIGRPNDQGYPIRGIVKGDYLFIQNFETDRWPAGNPETGYLNCDGSPTKTICLDAKDNPETFDYWKWSFGKRPAYELYNIKSDPECMDNLAQAPSNSELVEQLRAQLFEELKGQQDPRMFGKGNVFDDYQYADGSGNNFYERFMAGEKMRTGWVNSSDFRPLGTSN